MVYTHLIDFHYSVDRVCVCGGKLSKKDFY